jgi:hypothetical protein
MSRTRYSFFSEARCTAIVTMLYLYPPKRPRSARAKKAEGVVPWCSMLSTLFHAPFACEKVSTQALNSFSTGGGGGIYALQKNKVVVEKYQ